MIMNFEFLILDFIQEYIKNPVLDFVMPKITLLGNSGIIWIIAAIVMLCIPKYRKSGYALSAGLIVCLILGNLVLKPWIARVRPFDMVEGFKLLIAAPSDFSFPSGHTYSSVVGAAVLTMTDKRFGYVAIPLAVIIAFSRLYLYVHYPTDILGGILLGGIISVGLYFLFFKKKRQYK